MGYRFYFDKDLNYLIEEEQSFSDREYIILRNAKKRLRMYANLFNRMVKRNIITENSYCENCFTQDKLTLDHVIPIIKGGKNTIDNIQVLCSKCNRLKSDKI